MAFKEGTTLLSTGSMLPAGSLCGRTFKAQLGAKNAAGWSATYTTSATYIMPACEFWGTDFLLPVQVLVSIATQVHTLLFFPAQLACCRPALLQALKQCLLSQLWH